ncbi:GspH/FimT family pseudopilin [Dyella choica]|nr:GspH/FimT family protein [Dyella choica]
MSKVHAHRRRARGFTLVELAVVVAIVAIVLVYSTSSYKSITTQNRMASEINDISTDVELARSAAIKQGLPVTICPSANASTATPSCSGSASWNTGWIVFIDTTGNQTFDKTTGDTLLRMHAGLQAGDTLAGSTGTSATGTFSGSVSYLTFNRMGGTSIGGGTNFAALSLHDSASTSAFTRCLIVSFTGQGTIDTQISNAGVCP